MADIYLLERKTWSLASETPRKISKMPVLTLAETQRPTLLSSTVVERLAKRERERGEGRSSLKTRLRRWVGANTRRQGRGMGGGGRGVEVGRGLGGSIDSGIDLESSSSCLPVKDDEEERQSWTTNEPTPILRSSKTRGTVKKSISFSDGQNKIVRWVKFERQRCTKLSLTER